MHAVLRARYLGEIVQCCRFLQINKEAAITLCCLDKQKFRKSAGMATLHDIIRTKRGNAIFRQKCVCS